MSSIKPKVLRKHIKNDKRMLRLLYRKGLLDTWMDSHIHWAALRGFNKRYYRHHLCYIEPHFWVVDYWGEGDQKELISCVISNHIWKTITSDDLWSEEAEIKYNQWHKEHNSLKKIMSYLYSLPTKRCDSRINKYLKINLNDL